MATLLSLRSHKQEHNALTPSKSGINLQIIQLQCITGCENLQLKLCVGENCTLVPTLHPSRG